MEHQLNEQQKSMMRSVSKNIIGKFDLNPEPIYTGIHGQIFHITNQNSNHTMILKVVWKSNSQHLYKNEKHIHQSLKNRYVVQLEKCFGDELNYYFVMECCRLGNLRSLMSGRLAIDKVKDYGLQIAKGVHYLHKNKVIHHDIKPQNILVTDHHQIKICDFGLSAKFEEGKNVKGCQGSLPYAPPQAIEMHNQAYDVWSLGCLLYEMATGTVPFIFQNWKELYSTMNESYLKKHSYDSSLPSPLIHLLRKIFVFDKKERITIQQVLKHSFFTGDPLDQQQREEDRPLVHKKRSTKIMTKSVEYKGSKESLSKQGRESRESRESRENKENTDRCNKIVNKRNEAPNYKDILQKKFKKVETAIENSKHSSSGDKVVGSKTIGQDFKMAREAVRPVPATLTHFDNKNVMIQSRKNQLSPLNTLKMRINPIKLKNTEIRIDREGITREKHSKEHPSQLINISCDGLVVKMKKGKKEKIFSFDTLPQEYFKEYQQCKKILSEIQSQQVRVSYLDKNFMDRTLTLQILYSKRINISVEGEVEVKDLSAEQFLANVKNIREEYYKEIRNIYLRLVEMHRFG